MRGKKKAAVHEIGGSKRAKQMTCRYAFMSRSTLCPGIDWEKRERKKNIRFDVLPHTENERRRWSLI
jgi:hypothetical protein